MVSSDVLLLPFRLPKVGTCFLKFVVSDVTRGDTFYIDLIKYARILFLNARAIAFE